MFHTNLSSLFTSQIQWTMLQLHNNSDTLDRLQPNKETNMVPC